MLEGEPLIEPERDRRLLGAFLAEAVTCRKRSK